MFALDLPGFGFSERSDRTYSPVLYRNAITDFLANVVGEAADVVLLPVAQIGDLTKAGKLDQTARADVAKSGVGIAVREGAAKPVIRNGEDLKNALLKAKTISYSTGPSGVHMAALIKQWGIEDRVKGKVVIAPSDTPVGIIVARGGAEIGFQQVSELLAVKGIDLIGELPAAVQLNSLFAAGIGAKTPHRDAAQALIAQLNTERARQIMRDNGLTPAAR